MSTQITAGQVRAWLDKKVVRNVDEISGGETEYNLQFELSQLPIHVIKEEPYGPLRIVGRCGFDTERTQALINDAQQRRDLLTRIGPVLAATPGFYVFLGEDGQRCEFTSVQTIELEHRIYPNVAGQQQLMDGVIGIATAMRYIQNLVATMGSQLTTEDITTTSHQ